MQQTWGHNRWASATAGGSAAAQAQAQPMGSFGCARELVRTGGLRSLFLGLGASFARDLPTYPLYFCSFEWGLAKLSPPASRAVDPATGRRERPPLLATAVAGSCAGVLMWMATCKCC